jgi:hypothetical protein
MPDDYHIVKTIANELNKGVFIWAYKVI